MPRQSTELVVAAAQAEVWAVLSDLESAERYDAFIERSSYISEVRSGVGAARRCDLPDGSSVEERVIAWDEGSGYEIEASDDATGAFPLVNQRVRFGLEPVDGGTLVRMTFSYDYAPTIEIAAAEADEMGAALIGGVVGGLKHLVETGEPAPSPAPAAGASA
jgi:hypothetical protein